jgi:hypothetical protein
MAKTAYLRALQFLRGVKDNGSRTTETIHKRNKELSVQTEGGNCKTCAHSHKRQFSLVCIKKQKVTETYKFCCDFSIKPKLEKL